jgi:hypothetical protein
MSAFGEASETEPRSADPVTVRLDEILDELVAVVADSTLVPDAARIDRIARLERLRAATAALQTAESVRFAQSQVAEQLAADVHPDAIGRGIAEQIGLACRISPATAARRLNTARALEKRRHVDEKLKAAGIARMGFKAATACARKTAYQADPHGYVDRGRTERKHRRVGVRPAPDTWRC